MPLRIEVGPRDIGADKLPVARRDRAHRAIEGMSRSALLSGVVTQLDEIQQSLFNRALDFRKAHIQKIDSKKEFYKFFTPKNAENPEIHGGFAFTHWNGDPAIEEMVKKDLGVTIRCVPLDLEVEEGICPFSGETSSRRVIFAKSY